MVRPKAALGIHFHRILDIFDHILKMQVFIRGPPLFEDALANRQAGKQANKGGAPDKWLQGGRCQAQLRTMNIKRRPNGKETEPLPVPASQ